MKVNFHTFETNVTDLITLNVPTHSYLRKFALHRYNSQNGAIHVKNTNSTGILLFKILSRKPFRVQKRNISAFNSSITLIGSYDQLRRSGFELTDESIMAFNRFLKSQFEETLFDFLTINRLGDKKANVEQLILLFCAYYDVHEHERSLESLVKAYQRWLYDRNLKVVSR